MWRDIDESDASVGQAQNDDDYTQCWRCGHKVGVGAICPICAAVNKWEAIACHGEADNAQMDRSAEEEASSWSYVNPHDADAEWERGDCVNERKSLAAWKDGWGWTGVHKDDDGSTWLHVVLTFRYGSWVGIRGSISRISTEPMVVQWDRSGEVGNFCQLFATA
jgi:hypothetical protein